MAFDGVNIWSANSASESVSVLNAATGQHVMTPTVGSAPFAIAFDGSRAWVTNYNDHTINVVQMNDGAMVMTPTVGVQPWGIAYDGTYMWVANSGDDTVWVLDVLSGGLVVSATVGDKPQGLVFDGTSMWVANKDGHTVSRLTLVEAPTPTQTGTTTRTPTVTKTSTPFHGAYLPLALRQATFTPTSTATATWTATPLPIATIERPRLLDGYYVGNASGTEFGFQVLNNGTTARNGYYQIRSSTPCLGMAWYFSNSRTIVNGSIRFEALHDRYNAPWVSLRCTSTSSTSAGCTVYDQYENRYCRSFSGTARRQ